MQIGVVIGIRLEWRRKAAVATVLHYVGATIPIRDPENGEVHAAAVFVAVLYASSYTFAEATTGQDLRNWIGSHLRAFEFGVIGKWPAREPHRFWAIGDQFSKAEP